MMKAVKVHVIKKNSGEKDDQGSEMSPTASLSR